MKKNPHHSETPFSYSKLFSKSISNSLNVHLLMLQGMLIALSLLAFVAFSSFMVLMVFLTSMLSISSGFMPFAMFVVLFGFAIWVLGMLAINAFMNGVQFHLAMQAVTKRPLDLNLAWKLSSARWRDAFVIQGSMLGFFVGLFVLSLIVSFIFSGNAQIWSLINPFNWAQAGAPTLVTMGLLLVALQPFLLMILPLTYFENTQPHDIVGKLRRQIIPHYFQLLGTIVLLMVLNIVINSIAEYATTIPLQTPLGDRALTFVIFSGFAFLIQVIALLFTFTNNLNAQTLLYLHIGKPQASTQFVTTGAFSTALSKLAHSHPSHSGMLPVKWKKLGAKRKIR